jgi:integrase
MWMTAARTGLRRGELLALRWKDLDLVAGTATIKVGIGVDNHELYPVPRPKGKKHRTVDLDPLVVETLARWKQTQDMERAFAGDGWQSDSRFGDLVFTDPTGRPLHPNSVSRWFRYHVEHMDGLVPRTTLHQLRHAFGSALLAAGVPLGDVARRLGHSQQVLEKVYSKELAVLRDESRAVVLDAIEKLWGNGQS